MGFPEKRPALRRLKFSLILGMITFMHFAVTSVVVLFVLSTVSITGRKLHLPFDLKYLEIAVTALIFIVSAGVFFRSFNKITRFVRETIFRDPPD